MKMLFNRFLAVLLACTFCFGIVSVSATITGQSYSVEIGEQIQIVVPTDRVFTSEGGWGSSNPQVVRVVSRAGRMAYVEGVSPGSAKITVSYQYYANNDPGGHVMNGSYEFTVTVPDNPADSFSISSEKTLEEDGGFAYLYPTFSPADTYLHLTWTSSDEDVVTVEPGWLGANPPPGGHKITAHAPGTATITARAGGMTATCVVTVEGKVGPQIVAEYPVDRTEDAPLGQDMIITMSEYIYPGPHYDDITLEVEDELVTDGLISESRHYLPGIYNNNIHFIGIVPPQSFECIIVENRLIIEHDFLSSVPIYVDTNNSGNSSLDEDQIAAANRARESVRRELEYTLTLPAGAFINAEGEESEYSFSIVAYAPEGTDHDPEDYYIPVEVDLTPDEPEPTPSPSPSPSPSPAPVTSAEPPKVDPPSAPIPVALPSRPLTETILDNWQSPYSDAKKGDWFYPAVVYGTMSELFTGTSATTFSPGEDVSEAMVAELLYRIAGTPSYTAVYVPPDVTSSDWFYDSVLWSISAGVIKPYWDGEFKPDYYVWRNELADALYRFSGSPEPGDEPQFADMDDVPDAIALAYNTGLMTGTSDDTFSPEGYLTRAELATVLMRYIENRP